MDNILGYQLVENILEIKFLWEKPLDWSISLNCE
jgi:hypothetical protein